MRSIDTSLIDDARSEIGDTIRSIMAVDPHNAAHMRDLLLELAEKVNTAMSHIQDKIAEAASSNSER